MARAEEVREAITASHINTLTACLWCPAVGCKNCPENPGKWLVWR